MTSPAVMLEQRINRLIIVPFSQVLTLIGTAAILAEMGNSE